MHKDEEYTTRNPVAPATNKQKNPSRRKTHTHTQKRTNPSKSRCSKASLLTSQMPNKRELIAGEIIKAEFITVHIYNTYIGVYIYIVCVCVCVYVFDNADNKIVQIKYKNGRKRIEKQFLGGGGGGGGVVSETCTHTHIQHVVQFKQGTGTSYRKLKKQQG